MTRFSPGGLVSPAAAKIWRNRQLKSGLRLDSARAALADYEPGGAVFGLTKGQFSMIDIAQAVLEHTGPADVGLWTWAIADYEVQAVSAFMNDGRVRAFRLLMDYGGAKRDMPLVGELQAKFGVDCVRVSLTHAKIVTICNEKWRTVIRGSMNLNFNPRFEQFDVSDADSAFVVVETMMDEIWAKTPALPVVKVAYPDAAASLLEGGKPNAPAWADAVSANSASWWKA